MNVAGIEWIHPRYPTAYYGFNPTALHAKVGAITLTAWLQTTEAYETYWTVKAERSGERLFQINFVDRDTALAGAATFLETYR